MLGCCFMWCSPGQGQQPALWLSTCCSLLWVPDLISKMPFISVSVASGCTFYLITVWTCFWKVLWGGDLCKKCGYDNSKVTRSVLRILIRGKVPWIFKYYLLQANAKLLFPQNLLLRIGWIKRWIQQKISPWIKEATENYIRWCFIVLSVAEGFPNVAFLLVFLFLLASDFIIFKPSELL